MQCFNSSMLGQRSLTWEQCKWFMCPSQYEIIESKVTCNFTINLASRYSEIVKKKYNDFLRSQMVGTFVKMSLFLPKVVWIKSRCLQILSAEQRPTQISCICFIMVLVSDFFFFLNEHIQEDYLNRKEISQQTRVNQEETLKSTGSVKLSLQMYIQRTTVPLQIIQ